MKAALNDAPISVLVDAASKVFQTYESGVLDSTKCGTTTNHAVLVVGYGTNSKGVDFWLNTLLFIGGSGVDPNFH